MLGIILLAVLFECIKGNQRIVHVSKAITTAEDDNSHVCCVYGNCTCTSLDHALANLTSNVLINITTDVMLSSLIKRSDLQNVSIIGHNSPTMKCKIGGIHFIFCHNCIIQGITWDGCGTGVADNITEPGIKLNYSSNVTIQNCCFQHSIGQALVLSEVSGAFNINNCNFVNNSHYRGHGAAIYYSSSNTMEFSQFVFTIDNCNFTHNKHIKSLVYIENRLLKYHKIIFYNSIFSSNQGTSVYVINHKIYIYGTVLFWNNLAEDGTGICITDHSTVMFGENSNVTFNQNLANNRGGVVFLTNNSTCFFDYNSIITFYYNKATKGGAIYSEVHSNVTFNASCKVIFNNNSATQYGAAIYSLNYSHVVIAGSTRAIFNSNYVRNRNYTLIMPFGGIIYSQNNCIINFKDSACTVFINNDATNGGVLYSKHNSYISFEGTTSVLFNNNIAYKGGAMLSHKYSYISFEGNSTTKFIDNTAKDGGAIYSQDNCHISFEGNSTMKFSNNTADYGGAFKLKVNCSISFEGNSTTQFNNNTADYGGAIFSSDNSYIYLDENSATKFNTNAARQFGGAIWSAVNCIISLKGNSTTQFNNNTADYGGAIVSYDNSYIFLEGNTGTNFSNNTARIGGALFTWNNSYISLEGNSATKFSNNNASELGGALFSLINSYISFKGNSATKFSNNTAWLGGAIFLEDYCIISLERNSTTEFSNNAANQGGAIGSLNNCNISFEGNSTTDFSSNTADIGGAIIVSYYSHISLEGNSVTKFSNNTAVQGGAIQSEINGTISFEGNSTTDFSNNTAKRGGAICCYINTNVSFDENSATEFSNNSAKYGGAMFSLNNSCISFAGNSTTKLSNNSATVYGGAIVCSLNSHISFEGNSATLFSNNAADYGGGIFSTHNSYVTFLGQSDIKFINNTANLNGGAVLASNRCGTIFDNNSVVFFSNNNAALDTTILYTYHSIITVKGTSTVIFNNLPARWCFNTCLKHPGGESDSIAIDSSGIVWCGNQKGFTCQSNKYHCKNLEDILANATHNQLVNIRDKVVLLSSVINLNSSNISIIGHNNPTVMCVNHGGLKLYDCNNVTIEGITFIGCGAAVNIYGITYIDTPVLDIYGCNNVRIQKCSFQYSMGKAVGLQNVLGCVNINKCKFVGHINYRKHGAAICYTSDDHGFDEFIISNCYFSSYKAKSVIHFTYRSHGYNDIHLINFTFYNNEGVSIYLSSHHVLHLIGKVLFEDNIAENGAGIYISDHSIVIFGENSNSKFINNTAYQNGAAVFLNNNCSIIFDNNSRVVFNHNKASNGTIYSKTSSRVIFKAACIVAFRSNSAAKHGSAIYSYHNSQVVFKENSRVNFNDNVISIDNAHLQHGGVILCKNNGNIVFEENSIIGFSNNSGSAIFSISNSNVIFKDSSKVMFNKNIAHYCGVLTSALFSNITFTDNTIVTYDSNTVSYILGTDDELSAGAICSFKRSEITFTENSLVIFINNKVDRGGAVTTFESNVIMEEYSTVIFNNNFALYSSGGAFVCSNNSNVTIKGNSNVTYNNNKASQSGGAIYSYNMCRITFKENSTSTFIGNTASNNGGAIFGKELSKIVFEFNSTVIFDSNTADRGGVFYFTNSSVIFKGSSVASFHNNKARQSGGVGYFNFNSKLKFEGTIAVRFDNNMADKNAGVFYSVRSYIQFKDYSTISVTNNKANFDGGGLYFDKNSDVLFTEFTNITFQYNKAFYGGAILVNDHSNITITGKSVLLFISNEATQSGGAEYFNNSCRITVKQNGLVKYYHNKALQGGAVCINHNTKFIITGKSTATFYDNLATVSGGAINIFNKSSIILNDHVNISIFSNNAQYGGAIFLDTTSVIVNNIYKYYINFTNNIAKISGNSIYQDVAKICNHSCLINRIINIHSQIVTTPPNELKFYDPAICIDDDNGIHCKNYYFKDIMLGREIVIPACVLDYYDQPIDSTQFLVQSEMHSNILISGPKQTLISCDTFKGVSIMSNTTLLKLTNFTITITLNIALNSNWKPISVNLIIELSPCHPGFWQYPKSRTCECYNASDIVFCSGSSSTIKRGYWFGNVTGKPTVTFCPINYCNFTCCETSNGYYHLSPVRDNQCKSHRSGVACGSCEEGYTLSFDSVECVHVNECSIGWTILVLTLVVFYWIIIIVAVFSLMHFKVGIGYLYAITYYYSVVDLLLSQNWYHSNPFYTVTIIMSSVAKIIPQFLGKICFITNMSGIDQQFIHYIHPVAISLFLIMITVLARKSRRLSSFISKGIIHVICCLLLLSYTSLATTSLLLTRPLIFHDVDKIYTYVSPDVEYFHGRHFVYAIVALLFTIVIVIGLPLLLALEPFLNSKINFIRIKPLLDQFQGCYKDKYRCFAAYYMVCRLIIITIIIANSYNEHIFQYLLASTCVMMDLTHQLFRPYSNFLLNNFDGVILHFLVLVSVLPLVEIHSSFDSNVSTGIICIYIAVPLLIFITMSMIINKEKIKILPGYYYLMCLQLCLKNHNYYNEIPLNEIPLIKAAESSNEDEYINVIDDNTRKNATICEV